MFPFLSKLYILSLFSFPFPFPFLSDLSFWQLNEIFIRKFTEMWTTKAILLLINFFFRHPCKPSKLSKRLCSNLWGRNANQTEFSLRILSFLWAFVVDEPECPAVAALQQLHWCGDGWTKCFYPWKRMAGQQSSSVCVSDLDWRLHLQISIWPEYVHFQ